MSKLYEADFVDGPARARRFCALAFSEADIDHIAKGRRLRKSWRRSLNSRMKRLLMHLLKLYRQSSKAEYGRSWRTSASANPWKFETGSKRSLRRALDPALAANHARAMKPSIEETGFDPEELSAECPRRPDQVLDEEFWPQ
jgi:hypothetical protein